MTSKNDEQLFINHKPIGSMYGLFAYIYHRNQPNVGVYIYIYVPYMDPMGRNLFKVKSPAVR